MKTYVRVVEDTPDRIVIVYVEGNVCPIGFELINNQKLDKRTRQRIATHKMRKRKRNG